METDLILQKDITLVFLNGVKNCKEFHESLESIKGNSSGKIWLVGGFVYRTIASQLYGLTKPDCDLDFIVEVPVPAQELTLPEGWIVKKKSFWPSKAGWRWQTHRLHSFKGGLCYPSQKSRSIY